MPGTDTPRRWELVDADQLRTLLAAAQALRELPDWADWPERFDAEWAVSRAGEALDRHLRSDPVRSALFAGHTW